MMPSTKSTFLLLAIVLCLTLSVQQVNSSKWRVLSKKVSTLLFGCSFTDKNNGWVSGLSLSHGPVIMRSSNGGQTWNETNHKFDALVYMSVAMENTQNGIAGGIGLPTVPGLAYTNDGLNFNKPSAPFFLESTFLDAGVAAQAKGVYYAVGQWADVFNLKGEGFLLSKDAGATFKAQDWGQTGVGARYGSFLNDTYGFITGGSGLPILPDPNVIQLDHSLAIDLTNKKFIRTATSKQYKGVIAKTTNGRKFDVVFDSQQRGFNAYFNGIDFVDENHGWAVAQAVDPTNNKTASYIFSTTDGGSSWQQQFLKDELHLFKVKMADTKHGWAVGFRFPSDTLISGEFYRTEDGGKEWRREFVHFAIPFDISVLDKDNAYAVAFDIKFHSNVLVFE